MALFRLDSSIRTEGSISREVADVVEDAWVGHVVRRDIGLAPLPSDAWPAAVAGSYVPEEARTPEQRQALALAATLADELLDAQTVLIATPLYNFGVPAHVKAWIDLVITDPRFAPGNRPLDGKAVVLVAVRGGGYGAGTPREGWDHATPYLLRILGDVWGADVTLVEAELTLADVVPAMAELRDAAAASRGEAREKAATVGRAHAALTGRRRSGPEKRRVGSGRSCRVWEDRWVQGRSDQQRDLLDVESVAGHLLTAGSVFAFLAAHRQELFPEGCSPTCSRPAGRPSVPADVMASVIVLQSLHGFSDSETVER